MRGGRDCSPSPGQSLFPRTQTETFKVFFPRLPRCSWSFAASGKCSLLFFRLQGTCSLSLGSGNSTALRSVVLVSVTPGEAERNTQPTVITAASALGSSQVFPTTHRAFVTVSLHHGRRSVMGGRPSFQEPGHLILPVGPQPIQAPSGGAGSMAFCEGIWTTKPILL